MPPFCCMKSQKETAVSSRIRIVFESARSPNDNTNRNIYAQDFNCFDTIFSSLITQQNRVCDGDGCNSGFEWIIK